MPQPQLGLASKDALLADHAFFSLHWSLRSLCMAVWWSSAASKLGRLQLAEMQFVSDCSERT